MAEQIRDVSAEQLWQLYKQDRLGTLLIEIPIEIPYAFLSKGTVSVSLPDLLESATNLRSPENQTRPEEIEAICVFGNSLYRHFEHTEVVERSRKKWLLFGPEVVSKKTRTTTRMPKSFDTMVLTRSGLTEEKLVVTNRRVTISTTSGDTERVVYDGSSSGVQTETSFQSQLGEYYKEGPDLGLHTSYRSVEQFLAGLGNGDWLSEEVVKYGVPLVGHERFMQIIQGVSTPVRNPLHQVEWWMDSSEKLQGFIA